MEGLWIITVALTVAVVLLENVWRRRLDKDSKVIKWPAGPRPLPIIGNLHQLYKGGDLLHVTLANIAQVHGRIMTVWLGSSRPTIVVSDHELAWEVLVSKAPDYAARMLPYMSKFVTANWRTLATSDSGSYWQALRKGLQSCALNPPNISAQIHLQEKDMAHMIQSLQEEASMSGVVKPLLQLRRTTVRLVGRLCFGPEFKDEVFVEGMDSAVEDTIRLTGHIRLVDVFAFTRHIPGLKLPFQQTYEVKHRIEELIRPYISSHQSSDSPCPNCYLHFLLSQDLPEQVVIFNIFELFLLGVDSTSTATAWALAFLIRDPAIQQKLYEEINESGTENTVSVQAVSKMQYLHAVVKESMRMKPIAPLAVPHKAVKDSTLMGTKVMEGTSVLVNLYAVLYDPNVWHEPHRFMPERFLHPLKDGSGNDGSNAAAHLLRAMERSFLPFGAGRRICAGIELAKIHIALTLANLVKNFEWHCEFEGQLPDLTEDLTFVLRMKTPLAACIKPRHL
ncbi:(S)-canadine synthase-like [Magnolia sinica]|uniref:(S)-canadine synthase-like n=1 Tax=Magnolia sinica TaxID=86752 RepID=UPI0026599966|nr:(S)-canadine synthase-like [Magnolia sinica]